MVREEQRPAPSCPVHIGVAGKTAAMAAVNVSITHRRCKKRSSRNQFTATQQDAIMVKSLMQLPGLRFEAAQLGRVPDRSGCTVQ